MSSLLYSGFCSLSIYVFFHFSESKDTHIILCTYGFQASVEVIIKVSMCFEEYYLQIKKYEFLLTLMKIGNKCKSYISTASFNKTFGRQPSACYYKTIVLHRLKKPEESFEHVLNRLDL